MARCVSPKEKTLAGWFGESCGAVATGTTRTGMPVCGACAAFHERQWQNRNHPNTLGSVLSKALRDRRDRQN